jgi:replication-associated recombination protein RarA
VESNASYKKFGSIRNALFEATRIFKSTGQRTIFFLDEIDRINKEDQAVFLPYIEKGGAITLLAATPRDPNTILHPELLKKFVFLVLEKHTTSDLRTILERALKDEELGYGKRKIFMDEASKKYLCQVSKGNAREMLIILAQAVTFKMLMPKAILQSPSLHGGFIIDKSIIDAALANKKGKVSKKKIQAARLAALQAHQKNRE